MATGEHFTSDQMLRELENAGDNCGKLYQIITRYNLWKEGDPELPGSIEEIKLFIKNAIDDEETTKRTGLQELKTRLDTMMTHLAQKRKLEIRIKDYYVKTIEVLNSIKVTQFLFCLLNLHFPNDMGILRKATDVLKSGEVRIMIIGERCAGKSTILNLLMGGNYLAVDHRPCTKVICELKDSERRCATIHYKERLRICPKDVPLTTNPNTDYWKRVRNCMTSGFDGEQSQQSDERMPNIDKVVIFWPVLRINVVQEDCSQGPSDSTKSRNVKDSSERTAALEEKDTKVSIKERGPVRVTFVDTPGFGEDQETFSDLQSKAMSCDAYIFVINNGSHHGVEKDRLGKMMKKVQERARVANIILNPSSAFFICNKADLVPAEKKETLRRDVLRLLQAIWPGISEQQIFSFSASQALTEVIKGKITQTYCEFINQICNLVMNFYHLKLDKNCCWLISFLERASALANNCDRYREYAKQTKEKALKKLSSHKKNLNNLYNQCSDLLKRLDLHGIPCLEESIQTCLSVQSADLCTWTLENIPFWINKENWSQYKKRLNTETYNRIKATVMEDSKVSEMLDDYLETLQTISDNFLTRELERYRPRDNNLEVITSYMHYTLIYETSLLNMSRRIWKYKESADHVKDDSREDEFESDRLTFMQTLWRTHVKRSMEKPFLTNLASEIFAIVKSRAQVLMGIIKEGLNTLNEYEQAVTSGINTTCNDDPFRTITIHSHYFYTRNVMQHEIEFSRLKLDGKTLIGKGGCGYVYKTELQEGSQNIPIAAKIITGVRPYPKIENADTHVSVDKRIFRECCLMRQLMLKVNVAEDGGCPNFVHYYGSAFTTTEDIYQLILVMELCDTDLHKQVMAGSLSPKKNIRFPGKDQLSTSVSYAIDIALQAARGLDFVHKNGIVHRDVKPSNFLMIERNDKIIVKIADFGISKEQNTIATEARTIGTEIYQAPENLGMPLCIHTVFSDVYSFGLVLWEVWYGEPFFDKVDSHHRYFRIKNHPEFKSYKPPSHLIDLMSRCWRTDPTTRPDMETVVEELAQLKQN